MNYLLFLENRGSNSGGRALMGWHSHMITLIPLAMWRWVKSLGSQKMFQRFNTYMMRSIVLGWALFEDSNTLFKKEEDKI